ncbi:MAG: RNA methyltransferase [Terriglobales bacterium]
MTTITSRDNKWLKAFRAALRGKGPDPARNEPIGIEGPKLVEEALRSGLAVEALLVSESGERAAAAILKAANESEAGIPPSQILKTSDKLFESVSGTEAPQGVAALFRQPEWGLDDVLHGVGAMRGNSPLVVVLAAIQDPGNVGTILRSAEAFGAAGIFLTEGTVSPYNSKVLRGSAGSVFRLPFLQISSLELIPLLRARGVRLLATSSHQGTPLPQVSWTLPLAIFIGNEGAGLSRELTRQMDETVAIPQASQVESLNAGVAASIVLYEAARSSSRLPVLSSQLARGQG